jgi:hypothetical protein
MFMARKTQARTIPHTAKMEITTNRVSETRDGWISRNVRSTGGAFPPEEQKTKQESGMAVREKHDECDMGCSSYI